MLKPSLSSFSPPSRKDDPPRYANFVGTVMLLADHHRPIPAGPHEMVGLMNDLASRIVGYPGCADRLREDLDDWELLVTLACPPIAG